MKVKNRKKLIVSLITSDLIHAKLINGLEELGLNPDCYLLYLSEEIIDLMGFGEEHSEAMFKYYDDLKKRASFISNSDNNKAFRNLASDIYHNMQLQRPLQTE